MLNKTELEELNLIKEIVINPAIEALSKSIHEMKISIEKSLDELKKYYEISRSIEEQQWSRMNEMQNSIILHTRENIDKDKKIQELHTEIVKLPKRMAANRKWVIATLISVLGLVILWIKEIFGIIHK